MSHHTEPTDDELGMRDGQLLTLRNLPAAREYIEKLAGVRIPDAVLQHQPLGDKLIVLTEEPARRTAGGLHKPDQTIAAERGGAGWIIAVGHGVGINYLAAATGNPDPHTYLGLKVVYARYNPTCLRVSDTDDDYNSRFVVLREIDLHTIERL